MKLCASWSSSKMTQSRSRSSILLTLAVLIVAVVELSAQPINKAVNSLTEDITTEYNSDIQTFTTDSPITNEEEPHPEDPPNVVDLEHDVNTNIPSSENLNENGQSNKTMDTTTEQTFETEIISSFETTPNVPIPEVVTTPVPITEHSPEPKSSTDIQVQTEHPTEIQPETSTTDSQEYQMDSSRVDLDSESNSDNSSISSESKGSHSPAAENKASEGESTSSEDLSSEQISATEADSENEVIPDGMKSNIVDEIVSVTESTGLNSNDSATVVFNDETHTILKKPGVEDDNVDANPTELPILEEQSSQTQDPVVNFITERPKEQKSTNPVEEINSVTPLSIETVSKLEENVSSEPPKGDLPSEHDISQNEIPNSDNEPNYDLDVKTSTSASTLSNEKIPLLERAQEDQPIVEEDKIQAKEDSEVPNNELPPNMFETSTEKPKVENEPSLENNQIKPTTEINYYDGVSAHTNENEHSGEPLEPSTEKQTIDKSESPSNELPSNVLEASTEKPKVVDEPSLENNQIRPSTESSLEGDASVNELDAIETSPQNPLIHTNGPEISRELEEASTSTRKTSINPLDASLPDPQLYEHSSEVSTNQFTFTENYGRRQNDFDRTMKDETSSVVPHKIPPQPFVGRSFNELSPEAIGKPTRSVSDEPLSSSYSSSDDQTATVLVLCAATGGIFIAFSLVIYLISFQRQNGTLDIEMQEQRCGKDNLDEEVDDDDSQTRVSLLNQGPSADSDEHSSY